MGISNKETETLRQAKRLDEDSVRGNVKGVGGGWGCKGYEASRRKADYHGSSSGHINMIKGSS